VIILQVCKVLMEGFRVGWHVVTVFVCLKESLYIMFHGLKAQTLFADVTPTLGLHLHLHKHTFTLHA